MTLAEQTQNAPLPDEREEVVGILAKICPSSVLLDDTEPWDGPFIIEYVSWSPGSSSEFKKETLSTGFSRLISDGYFKLEVARHEAEDRIVVTFARVTISLHSLWNSSLS